MMHILAYKIWWYEYECSLSDKYVEHKRKIHICKECNNYNILLGKYGKQL